MKYLLMSSNDIIIKSVALYLKHVFTIKIV